MLEWNAPPSAKPAANPMTGPSDNEEEVYRFWCSRGTWDASEASILLAGGDPRKVNSRYLDYCTPPEAAVCIREIFSRLNRAIQAGIIPLIFTPSKLVQWADQQGVHVPNALRSEIIRHTRKRSKSGETIRANSELDITAALLVKHHNFDPNKPMEGLTGTLAALLTAIGRSHDAKTIKRIIDDVREILRQ